MLHFHNPLEKDAVTPRFFQEVWLPMDLAVCVGFPSFHLDALLLRCRQKPVPLVVQNYITADFLKEILEGQGSLNRKLRSLYWKDRKITRLNSSH